MNIKPSLAEFDAWNPGLESEVPREYLPLSTIFRSENVLTGIAKAHELSDYCGLPVEELVAFRAERLIVHELLIRVTTSLAVPDGRDYEDLGRNFRQIAGTILDRYIAPHRAELALVLDRLRAEASSLIERELAKAFAVPKPAAEPEEANWLRRLFAVEPTARRPPQAIESGRARPADRCRMAEKIRQSGQPAGASLFRRPMQGRDRGHEPARPAVRRQRLADGTCADDGLQRLRQRGHRRRHRAVFPRGGCARRLPSIAAAGKAGRHERQGRLGLWQKHDAAAAENPARKLDLPWEQSR